MSNANVWIVEHGEYSDYTVDGVFSTEENANLFCAQMNQAREDYCYQASVQKMDLDPCIPMMREGMKCWNVTMTRKGKSTVEATEPETVNPRSRYSLDNSVGFNQVIRATVWAKDGGGAAKIVNEFRAQEIATGRWKNNDDEGM